MMATFLDNILAHTREEIARARTAHPVAELMERARARSDIRSLAAALAPTQEPRIIAEVKRASPSRGDIRRDLDPAELAAAYEAGGAAAVSVLTETAFFKGSLADLQHARAAVTLPVLRKDFVIDPYQVVEAAAAGADAVLIIVRILDDALLTELLAEVRRMRIEALVEVHSVADLARATAAGATVIGINNRDLESFETRLEVSLEIARGFAANQLAVAASGIAGREDIEQNLAVGISRFLVGESLVRAANPAALLRRMRGTTS